MKKILKEIKEVLERLRLLPSFDEDTIFLLALALVIILFIDSNARSFAGAIRDHSSKATLIVFSGIVFAFYTAFFALFKDEIQKFYMLWFAVVANFFSAVAVLNLANEIGNPPFYYITPILNIVIAVVMVIFWYADLLDTSTIPHKSSSYTNLLYGTLTIFAITMLSVFIFHWPWPVTVSLSIAYASMFNRSVARYLPKIFSSRDERIRSIDELVEKLVEYLRRNLNMKQPVVAALATSEILTDVEMSKDESMETQLNEKARTFLKAMPIVATGALGHYTYKRFWFSPEKSKVAIIIDVYERGSRKGYRFSQMLNIDEGDAFSRYKGIIYLGKIDGI